ncbi:unnamed protein product [Larinioides sclopetarius]|uniref:Uncharacterized protein n=1 Tax=Larinioides sclopetarius TaxID=280406 RepID=A0AAV2BIR2_9ARAC
MKIHALLLCLIVGAWMIGSEVVEAGRRQQPPFRPKPCPNYPEMCTQICRKEMRGCYGDCEGPGSSYCICKG